MKPNKLFEKKRDVNGPLGEFNKNGQRDLVCTILTLKGWRDQIETFIGMKIVLTLKSSSLASEYKNYMYTCIIQWIKPDKETSKASSTCYDSIESKHSTAH